MQGKHLVIEQGRSDWKLSEGLWFVERKWKKGIHAGPREGETIVSAHLLALPRGFESANRGIAIYNKFTLEAIFKI